MMADWAWMCHQRSRVKYASEQGPHVGQTQDAETVLSSDFLSDRPSIRLQAYRGCEAPELQAAGPRS